jgi:glycosyltransferase involved in cell wall biosynthesis
MSASPKLLVISVNNIGHGLSGGDRIWVNFCKHWRQQLDIFLLGVPESVNLVHRHGFKLPNAQIDTDNNHEYISLFALIIHQIRRTVKTKLYILRHLSKLKEFSHVLSVSDFYPDFLTGFTVKIIRPQIIWIASFYLSAPKPWDKNSPYIQNHQQLKGWLYYLSQIPSLFIINHFADIILVTSYPDTQKFPHKKVIVVRGGVDTVNYKKYLNSSDYILPKKRQYLGCYLGRLHVQKGVLRLVDIWKMVVKKIPNAKLAIIGNGQLEKTLKNKIKKLRLEKNIDLYGFLDGQPKIKIFQNSQIMLHPATFDSGGMAAAEGLSWGLPGISFDLEALKTYYPQGFIKIPCFDNQKFADSIIKLSQDQVLYQKLSNAGIKLISDFWTWDKQSQSIYKQLFS